jgi:branched-chain amino acid transport system substrate-binding protein
MLGEEQPVSQMNRRQALKLLTALGATGLAAGCNTNTSAGAGSDADEPVNGNPISIGLIAPQTGGYKPIGDEIVKGFQLFLKLNGQQLGGHPVAQAGGLGPDRRGRPAGDARHPRRRRAGPGAVDRLQRLAVQVAERRLHLAHVVRQ